MVPMYPYNSTMTAPGEWLAYKKVTVTSRVLDILILVGVFNYRVFYLSEGVRCS